MNRRLFVRSALPGGSNTSSEDKPPGPTSQQATPTTGSPSVPNILPSVSTGPDLTTTTSSSSHASSATQSQNPRTTQSSSPPPLSTSWSTVSSLGAYPPLTSPPTPGQIPSASISSTFPSSFDLPSSYQSDGTSTTYNGSSTSTDEPKSPSPSYSSMNLGNGGQTKTSALSNAASTPSPIGGTGGTPQNSPPNSFSPPLSDIGPSPTVPSGVDSSPPRGSGSGLSTSIHSQSLTQSFVTSFLPIDLPGQQTSTQSPSLTNSPTSETTTSSSASTSMSSKLNGPPQTTTSAPTSTTSSSQKALSLLSSILSPNTAHNDKSSATTSSSSLPTDSTTSTSKSSNAPPQTTTNVPTPTTSSSHEVLSLLSSILSPSKTHNAAKSTATTSSSFIPIDSTTTTSTTTSAPTLTSSSQDRSIISVSSSTDKTHHPAKSSATTSSSLIPTETTTSTTSAHVSTSSSQDGSITSVSSSTLSPDKTNKPGKSPATTSPALTGDPQTPSGEKSSPSSTDDSPPTTQPQKAHTHTTTTPNSPAPAPTGHPGQPITTSSTTLAGDSPTTMPGEKSHSPQSPSGNLAGSPSPTTKGVTSVTNSSGSRTVLVVKPSNDPAGTPSFAPHGTTLSIVGTVGTTTSVTQGVVSHSTPSPVLNVVASTAPAPIPGPGQTWSSTIFTTESIVSVAGSTTYTTKYTVTSSVVVSTSIPGSGARLNEDTIIEGVVSGILALVVLAIATCYFIRRRRRSRQQQLHYRDLTAPLSPEAIETMRETHPYRPTYDSVGGQCMRESLDTMHRTSSSFISSAFAFPRPAPDPGSLHSHVRNTSGSVFYENDSTSNDGHAFSGDEGSEGMVRYSASEQSLYTSNDWQSSVSVGVGIAIGSESSMDLHSYRTAAATLAPVSTLVDNDEEVESPEPSPSSFPAPPNSSSMNPFLDVARTAEYPDVETLHALHRDAVSALSEVVALAPTRAFPEQQASWTAAAAAASPTNAQIPKTTRSLNPFTEASYEVTKIPTQSEPLVTPFSNSSFIVNPFLRETSQEGFSDDSRSSESHETVAIPYAYSDPFEFMDKGKGNAYLSADLSDDIKRNRLSNSSFGHEIPENPSQCGVAL